MLVLIIKQIKLSKLLEWVVDDEGDVIFVAKMPENNSQSSMLSSVDCERFSAVGEYQRR